MKTRKGLDDDHLTYLDAGRIAQETGVAAIALHGRTVAQSYSGVADWDAIAALVDHVDIPVLGNGDIWEAGGRGADGRADRRRGRRRRSGLPGPAVAVPRPGGGLRRDRRPDPAEPRRGAHDDAPPRRAAVRAHGGGARLQGVPQARVVVPQGLPRRRHAAALAGPRRLAGGARRRCSPSWTRTSRSRSPSWARRGVVRARRGPAWCCPRAGSTTPTGGAGTSRRTPPRPPAADPGGARRSPRGVTGNTPAIVHPGFGQSSTSVLDSCFVSVSLPKRDGPSPVSNSKGSALWHTIATSGKPMPAACPEPPSWLSRSPSS